MYVSLCVYACVAQPFSLLVARDTAIHLPHGYNAVPVTALYAGGTGLSPSPLPPPPPRSRGYTGLSRKQNGYEKTNNE